MNFNKRRYDGSGNQKLAQLLTMQALFFKHLCFFHYLHLSQISLRGKRKLSGKHDWAFVLNTVILVEYVQM